MLYEPSGATERDISRSCHAPCEISRSPRLAHKVPVMHATSRRECRLIKETDNSETTNANFEHSTYSIRSPLSDIPNGRRLGNLEFIRAGCYKFMLNNFFTNGGRPIVFCAENRRLAFF